MKNFKNICWLLLILLIVFLLRVPSLFEPYWYGDEQIYLAIAQAMNRGAILYRDIWDNKPPLLYALYAIVPTLLWAKALATVFVLGTCSGVYLLSRKIFQDRSTVFSLLTTALTGIFLSIPLFEGTIANAELFFALPIVLAAAIIYSSFDRLGNSHRVPIIRLIALGLLMSCAFLLKVPALFDFMGMFLWIAILLFDPPAGGEIYVSFVKRTSQLIRRIMETFLPIGIAFFIPVVAVVWYFFLNQALSDFLIASFSQNASYVSIDSGPLSKLSNPLFIKGIILIVSCLVLVAGYLKKFITKELLFLSLWFGFSLYGSLLSNRPYMHYLLQAVPPALILVLYLIYTATSSRKNILGSVVVAVMVFGSFYYLNGMFRGAFHLPFKGYYQNFYDYFSERKLWIDYISFFDSRTPNSYAIGNFISKYSKPDDSIFVWGDAASVYVLSDRPGATRFIQSHHLTTIDRKNYDLIIDRLEALKPKFIIIDRPVHFQFPALETLVLLNYEEVKVFKDLHTFQVINN